MWASSRKTRLSGAVDMPPPRPLHTRLPGSGPFSERCVVFLFIVVVCPVLDIPLPYDLRSFSRSFLEEVLRII